MRILIWCPLISLGGGIRLLLQLVAALARQDGIDLVRVAVPPGAISSELDLTTNICIEVFEITQPWIERDTLILGIKGTGRLKRLMRSKSFNWQLEKLRIASHDCNVVYCFWPHLQKFPEIDKPVICTYQDTTILDFPEIMGGTATKGEWQSSAVWIQKSAQVIVSSNITKANLIRHFGEQGNSAIVIPHAILITNSSIESSFNLKELTKLPSQYIIYPANITAHKNHYNLLIAWSRFSRRKELPLVLFGNGTEAFRHVSPNWPDGEQWSRLAGLVNRLSLHHEEDFFALGYISDLTAMTLISNAKALIMPSLSEGGGSFPVEEALSFGIPVLCSDIPVMREHLANRSAQIVWFDPESPDAIVQALYNLLNNYSEFKQSAVNGVKDPRLTWDEVAAKYIDVFRKAVRQFEKAKS